jgi:hypothetical protein
MDKLEQIFSYTDGSNREHHGLSVNVKTGELYWDQKKIITDQKLSLSWWVNTAIILGSISTLALAILDLLRFTGE